MPPSEPRPARSGARAWIAMAGLVGAGLAGCAGEPAVRPESAPPDSAPYVGAFTGQFVDGKPLYRLPTIEVVGSRLLGLPGI